MKKLTILSSIVLIYSILQGSVSYLLHKRYVDEAASYADQITLKNIYVYEELINLFRPLPKSIFSTLIDFEDLKSLILEANSSSLSRKEHLRKTIFKTLKPIYEQTLKPEGFNQLQLHLKNSERFLQLFNPLVYGDTALSMTNFKTLKEPLVFSEGYNGISKDYHYYFPLFYNKSKIGTIEMSIPFNFFNKSISKAIEGSTVKILPASFTKEDLAKISLDASKKMSVFSSELLLKQKSSLILENGHVLSAFAIFNANGEISGYLTNFKKSHVISAMRSHFIEDSLISAILLVVVIILGLLYYRYITLAISFKNHDDLSSARSYELEQQNNFMRSLFQTIPSPAFLKNQNGEFLKCNEAFAELFEQPANKIIGSSIKCILSGDQAREAVEIDEYVLSTQKPFSYEQYMKIGDENRVFIIHKNILRNNGDILGIVGIMQDITDRKNHQQKLENAIKNNNLQQAQLKQDSEIIDHYVVFVKLDNNGIILDASSAMVNISGFSKDELIGKTWYSFCKESNQEKQNLRNQIVEQNRWKGVLSFTRKDGNTYWLKCTALAQNNELKSFKSYIVFGTDISNEIRISGLSYIDELTKIYNRKKFTESLESALRISRRYPDEKNALIFFDIDDFKSVNDTHGHLVGDSILQELTALVQKHLREVDTFARWGGEEFAIIAPKTGMQGALKMTEKLRELISSHYFKKAEHITCSFGVTEIKPDDTKDTLVERVDRALYTSKNRGKNRIEFLN